MVKVCTFPLDELAEIDLCLEATCQKQVYITVPAYYNAAQRRRYKELLVEHFFFRPSLQAALGFVDQCEACLLCLVGDKVEFNMERNDALIVCHVEEQTTVCLGWLFHYPNIWLHSILTSLHRSSVPSEYWKHRPDSGLNRFTPPATKYYCSD